MNPACGEVSFYLFAQHGHGACDDLAGVVHGKTREMVVFIADAFEYAG